MKEEKVRKVGQALYANFLMMWVYLMWVTALCYFSFYFIIFLTANVSGCEAGWRKKNEEYMILPQSNPVMSQNPDECGQLTD